MNCFVLILAHLARILIIYVTALSEEWDITIFVTDGTPQRIRGVLTVLASEFFTQHGYFLLFFSSMFMIVTIIVQTTSISHTTMNTIIMILKIVSNITFTSIILTFFT